MSVVSSIVSSRTSASSVNARASSLMDSIFAIGSGLALRFVVDTVSHQDFKITGTLIGLWEGVVMLHFVQKMPRSYDPYVAYGVRLFVDFLVTESLSRLVLVLIWTGLGMVLADISPAIWVDVGLNRIWRRFRRDMYTISQSVPRVAFFPIKERTVRFSPSRTPSVISESASANVPLTDPSQQPSTSRVVPIHTSTTTLTTVTRKRPVPGFFPDDRTETETEAGSILGMRNPVTARPPRVPHGTSHYRLSIYPRTYPEEDTATDISSSQSQNDLDEANLSSGSSSDTETADPSAFNPSEIVEEEEELEDLKGKKPDLEPDLTPKAADVDLPDTHDDIYQHEPPPPSGDIPQIPSDAGEFSEWEHVEREEGGEKPPPLPPKDEPRPASPAPTVIPPPSARSATFDNDARQTVNPPEHYEGQQTQTDMQSADLLDFESPPPPFDDVISSFIHMDAIPGQTTESGKPKSSPDDETNKQLMDSNDNDNDASGGHQSPEQGNAEHITQTHSDNQQQQEQYTGATETRQRAPPVTDSTLDENPWSGGTEITTEPTTITGTGNPFNFKSTTPLQSNWKKIGPKTSNDNFRTRSLSTAPTAGGSIWERVAAGNSSTPDVDSNLGSAPPAGGNILANVDANSSAPNDDSKARNSGGTPTPGSKVGANSSSPNDDSKAGNSGGTPATGKSIWSKVGANSSAPNDDSKFGNSGGNLATGKSIWSKVGANSSAPNDDSKSGNSGGNPATGKNIWSKVGANSLAPIDDSKAGNSSGAPPAGESILSKVGTSTSVPKTQLSFGSRGPVLSVVADPLSADAEKSTATTAQAERKPSSSPNADETGTTSQQQPLQTTQQESGQTGSQGPAQTQEDASQEQDASGTTVDTLAQTQQSQTSPQQETQPEVGPTSSSQVDHNNTEDLESVTSELSATSNNVTERIHKVLILLRQMMDLEPRLEELKRQKEAAEADGEFGKEIVERRAADIERVKRIMDKMKKKAEKRYKLLKPTVKPDIRGVSDLTNIVANAELIGTAVEEALEMNLKPGKKLLDFTLWTCALRNNKAKANSQKSLIINTLETYYIPHKDDFGNGRAINVKIPQAEFSEWLTKILRSYDGHDE